MAHIYLNWFANARLFVLFLLCFKFLLWKNSSNVVAELYCNAIFIDNFNDTAVLFIQVNVLHIAEYSCTFDEFFIIAHLDYFIPDI